MCCFLICFYNPNKFVSHTPRLEKGVVLQFRIAVCSQLRQRICCKAVAARKRRSPAVLWLHRCWPLLCTHTATTSPSTAGKGSARSALLQAQVPGKAAEQPHAPVSPPAGKDTVALQGSPWAACALHRHRCALCCCLLFLQVLQQARGSVASPKHPGSDRAMVWGQKPLADVPSAVSSVANCILLSPPVPDSSLARKDRKKTPIIISSDGNRSAALLFATPAEKHLVRNRPPARMPEPWLCLASDAQRNQPHKDPTRSRAARQTHGGAAGSSSRRVLPERLIHAFLFARHPSHSLG